MQKFSIGGYCFCPKGSFILKDMAVEAPKDKPESHIIEISLEELQDQAKRELGRYLTREEIENAIDLQPFAISQLISLTVELCAVEPDAD